MNEQVIIDEERPCTAEIEDIGPWCNDGECHHCEFGVDKGEIKDE